MVDELDNDTEEEEEKEVVEESDKKGKRGVYERFRKPDFSMGQMQFDRWRDMMNYATQVGIRVKSGETELYNLYRGVLYELYRQLYKLFELRGMKKPIGAMKNKKEKGLISLINDCFEKGDELKRKSDTIDLEDEPDLSVVKTNFMIAACDNLSKVAGFLADAIQECGLGIPTSEIMSRQESKRKTDSGGLF